MPNPKLTPSKIEYFQLNWDFFPGCRHYEQGKCPMKRCWARGCSRFKDPTFTPYLIPELLPAPLHRKKPAIIGVNFMGDLGGDWVNPEEKISLIYKNTNCSDSYRWSQTLQEWVFHVCRECPQHTFLFLTKNPEAWQKWGKWPDNCRVGATICNVRMFHTAIHALVQVEAQHKWLSIEPYLSPLRINRNLLPGLFRAAGIDWIVIGQQTPARTKTTPRVEDIRELVEAADCVGSAVWLKDNLATLLRQNNYNLYSFPDWAGKQIAVTGDHSLNPTNPHPNEPMRRLRQEIVRTNPNEPMKILHRNYPMEPRLLASQPREYSGCSFKTSCRKTVRCCDCDIYADAMSSAGEEEDEA